MKPEQHLIEIQRAYPKAHRYLDQARASGMVGGPDWVHPVLVGEGEIPIVQREVR